MSRRKAGKATDPIGTEITRRAGAFLDRAYAGPHKNKRIAQQLGVSSDMAKVLRRGRGWTAQRLGQVAGRFGWAFLTHVFSTIAGGEEHAEGRVARLLAEIERLSEEYRAGPWPRPRGGAGDLAHGHGAPDAGRGGDARRQPADRAASRAPDDRRERR